MTYFSDKGNMLLRRLFRLLQLAAGRHSGHALEPVRAFGRLVIGPLHTSLKKRSTGLSLGRRPVIGRRRAFVHRSIP